MQRDDIKEALEKAPRFPDCPNPIFCQCAADALAFGEEPEDIQKGCLLARGAAQIVQSQRARAAESDESK
jgi:hypothetical protein